MAGVFPIVSLLVALAVSMIVTRVAAMALMFTGMSREAAKFQARSAFTGAGLHDARSRDDCQSSCAPSDRSNAHAARKSGSGYGGCDRDGIDHEHQQFDCTISMVTARCSGRWDWLSMVFFL